MPLDSRNALVPAHQVASPQYLKPPVAKKSSIALGVIAIAVAVGGLGVWGTLVPLASAVVASGKFTVDSKRKTVQHAEGGTISAIYVRDGDVAKAGEVLVEFEGGQVSTSHAIARIAYFDAVVTAARLRAMLVGQEDFAVPRFVAEAAAKDAEVSGMINSQKTLLQALVREQDGQVRVLNQRIEQLKDEISGIQSEQTAAAKQEKMAADELATLMNLSERGYATRDRVLGAQREKVQLEGMLGRFRSRIAGAYKEISTTELEILQLGVKRKRETVAELRDIEHRIFDLKERYLDAASRLDRLQVRAPVSGTVVESRTHTVGGVVRPGDPLLEIVPAKDRLVVAAQVQPQDIDSLSVGQTTEVRLTGLNQRVTAPMSGRVVYLSADSLTDQRTQSQYFAVHVAIDPSNLAQQDDVALLPGMPADIVIKTGSRTAMAYLMQPLFDSMNRAWREN